MPYSKFFTQYFIFSKKRSLYLLFHFPLTHTFRFSLCLVCLSPFKRISIVTLFHLSLTAFKGKVTLHSLHTIYFALDSIDCALACFGSVCLLWGDRLSLCETVRGRLHKISFWKLNFSENAWRRFWYWHCFDTIPLNLSHITKMGWRQLDCATL